MALQIGSQGDDVRKLQQQLLDAGYDPKGIDGIYGRNTAAAVSAYQKAKGLTANGIAGDDMFGSLTAPVISPAAMKTASAPTIPTGLVQLRGTAEGQGLIVDSSGATPIINGMPISTAGLQNIGGSWYGTPDQINGLLSPYASQGRPEASEYDSPYGDQINSILNQLQNRKFEYDPNSDAALQNAYKSMSRNVMETTNSRGILNSTITENQIQQGYADLIPQYESIARQNFNSETDRIQNMLSTVLQMDQQQYQRWSDDYERRYTQWQDSVTQQEKKQEAQRQKITDAWDRTNELGYVDNKSSVILGVAPGTLSKDAREAKVKREQELADQRTQLQQQKELAKYQHDLSTELAAYRDSLSGTTDLSKMGTQAQVQNYYDLLNTYSGNGPQQMYLNNPYAAYQHLIQNRKANVDVLGDKLYNQLIADVQGMMKNQKSYGEKVNTATTLTVDDYASAMDKLYVIDNGEGAPKTIDKKGAQAYIDKLIMQGVDEQITDSLAAKYGIE